MAKRPTAKQILAFRDTLKSLYLSDQIEQEDMRIGANKYKSGLKSKREILDDLGVIGGMSDAEYKQGTDLRNIKSIKETAKVKGKKNVPDTITINKKGGGKLYATQNKKYGGGVYPRPTKGEDI